MSEEIARRDYNKIAGGLLLGLGILVAILGGSLFWFEMWRHILGPARGIRG